MGTLRALADTSIFIALEQGRELDLRRVPRLAVSYVTIGELRSGVLQAADIATRSARLQTLSDALMLDPLPVDEVVANAWAELRARLRDTGRRLAINDGWIAATAIAHKLPLVTQDRDYDGVPGLDVVTL